MSFTYDVKMVARRQAELGLTNRELARRAGVAPIDMAGGEIKGRVQCLFETQELLFARFSAGQGDEDQSFCETRHIGWSPGLMRTCAAIEQNVPIRL